MAQSKIGKEAQIEEMALGLKKAQAETAVVRERLELALVEEQQVVTKWACLGGELHEGGTERSVLLTSRVKTQKVIPCSAHIKILTNLPCRTQRCIHTRLLPRRAAGSSGKSSAWRVIFRGDEALLSGAETA